MYGSFIGPIGMIEGIHVKAFCRNFSLHISLLVHQPPELAWVLRSGYTTRQSDNGGWVIGRYTRGFGGGLRRCWGGGLQRRCGVLGHLKIHVRHFFEIDLWVFGSTNVDVLSMIMISTSRLRLYSIEKLEEYYGTWRDFYSSIGGLNEEICSKSYGTHSTAKEHDQNGGPTAQS